MAADGQPVTRITDVGSFTGEFLEAFMDRFPEAKGQWTEPVATNQGIAERRLKRFGNNASYRIGCPSRDLAQNCVPAGTQVLLTSWLSIHQDLPGIQRFYKIAYGLVPAGGWVINIDHVGAQDADWHHRLEVARATLDKEGLAARIEGPPVHHPDFRTPLLEDQIAALHAAGFTQVHVAWRRLDTVLLMARK
ncbi:hypothetical protein [Novosphingobium sp. 9]|uniref:hypothetical protein n=1 Tax=Novosphingobium sp. 9 TaxID=2025349 RepID=UPI0021B50809|nr:hypothetical protein [Novosphingobium sp. 9]